MVVVPTCSGWSLSIKCFFWLTLQYKSFTQPVVICWWKMNNPAMSLGLHHMGKIISIAIATYCSYNAFQDIKGPISSLKGISHLKGFESVLIVSKCTFTPLHPYSQYTWNLSCKNSRVLNRSFCDVIKPTCSHISFFNLQQAGSVHAGVLKRVSITVLLQYRAANWK